MDILRFSTAGSVDDGKSTLIGRLLYDTKSIFEDTLEAVAAASTDRKPGEVDLALFTDGLRAEREQGITIDVAYRYFATPKRKFIIADCPGHEQYTRNMATGCSTADLCVVLVDARHGMMPQSRRHTFIAHLLAIPHLVVAINKMDAVGFDPEVYRRIEAEFDAYTRDMGFSTRTFLPMSAKMGDNVVEKSARTPWYDGPPLLSWLETVDVATNMGERPFRFPVQLVQRPHQHFRGYAGQIASGTVAVGDRVIALPSARSSRVKRIFTLDGDLSAARAPQSVSLLLEDEIDISRGDMIAPVAAPPTVARSITADLVWFHPQALDVARPYLVKHTTRTVRARVAEVLNRIDVNTATPHPASGLGLNDIGRVRLECALPLFLDAYRDNRATGAIIVIDPATNATVAAGMIREARADADDADDRINRAWRERRAGHRSVFVAVGSVVVPGQEPPGAASQAPDGATDDVGSPAIDAIVEGVETHLLGRGFQAYRLVDTDADPDALAVAARLLLDAGLIVVAALDAAPSPSRLRAALRRTLGERDFIDVRLAPVASSSLDSPNSTADGQADLLLATDDWSADRALSRIQSTLVRRGVYQEVGWVSDGEGV